MLKVLRRDAERLLSLVSTGDEPSSRPFDPRRVALPEVPSETRERVARVSNLVAH